MQSPDTRRTLSARYLDDILLRCLSYALDTLLGSEPPPLSDRHCIPARHSSASPPTDQDQQPHPVAEASEQSLQPKYFRQLINNR